MSGIDWSEAPEDATHYAPEFGKAAALWAKKVGSYWHYCSGQGRIWYAGVQPDDKEVFIERPAVWSGIGLPPVGTVCEFQGDSAKCPFDPWHSDLHDGVKCTVIAYFKSKSLDLVAFTFVKPDGNTEVEQSLPGALCPIRTPEQIAAEECDKAVKAMLAEFEHTGSLTSHYEVCEALHKAGYRKFEIIDEPKS